MSIHTLYKLEFLDQLIQTATQAGDNLNLFAMFQKNALQKYTKNFRFHDTAVCILNIDRKNSVVTHLEPKICPNKMRPIFDNYEKYADKDRLSPLSALFPGTAVFSDSAVSHKQFKDQSFHQHLLQSSGVKNILWISYKLPFHYGKYLFLYYVVFEGSDSFDQSLTEEEVEYYNFPFALGWQYMLNKFDAETFIDAIHAIERMTLPRFRVMRSLWESGNLNAKNIAKNLGMNAKNFYNHIDNAYEKMLMLRMQNPHYKMIFGESEKTGNSGRIWELMQANPHFTIAPAKSNRILPRRRAM